MTWENRSVEKCHILDQAPVDDDDDDDDDDMMMMMMMAVVYQAVLKALGKLTPDQKVRCSVRDFNKYRAFLRRISHNEFRKQQAEQLRDGWEKRRLSDAQRLVDDAENRRREEERAHRYQRMFEAEMVKRWQKQAGQIQERKERARQTHIALVREYSRNLAKAFAGSRLINPADKKSADEMKKLQDAMDDAFRAVSGDALDNLPGLKKKAVVKRAAYSGKYPTRVENLDKTGRNVKPEDERTYSDHHVVQFSNRPSVIERDEPVARGSLRPVSEHELTPAPSQEALVDLGPTSLEHLSAEDKDLMETLLMKLLSDTRDGSIAREDLIKLTSLCSTLWGAEEGTSTTSLAAREIVNMSLERVRADIVMGKVPDADLILATSALARTASEGSLTSEKLEMYLNDTLDRAWNEKEDADDEFNAWLVEETIKSTVDQLTTDLVSGNLSRAEVREIGSAVASVVLGEVRSDDSMLADEVIVPTLQQFLQDSESIDETLLDHTLATLLSSYTHVVRRLDKPVWDIIKDFVVEILLRSKMNLREMTSDPDEFVEALRIERVAAGRDDMDLPQQEELLEVLATAVSKFVGCLRPTPVLCDLMRAILGPAQDDLARRRSAECLTIPKINPSMIDQVGESACCLEVALEITASVCDGLALEMAADKEFRDTTIMRLGPAFLFIILANWEEVSAGVDKDTVAIQTSKEFRKDPVVRPSQAESLVLLCMHRLWQDSQGDYLPDNTIVLMATQVAEFPALAPVQLHGLDREVHGVHLPGHVCRKIVKLDEMLTRGSLGYDEAKKLLAIVLHIYIREVLCSDGTLKKEPKSCDCNKLDDMEMDVDVNFYSVTEALQTVAEEAYTDLGGMNLDIEIAEDDLSQLEFIIRATSKDQVDVFFAGTDREFPVSDRMVTFLISLMLELRRVVMEEILPQEAAYDFLKTIAPEVCTPSARSSARALNNVIVEVVQDIEFHRSGSCFFIRIARQLSRTTKEDALVEKEVIQQSRVIAHVAIQKTLERLGATPTGDILNQEVIHTVVRRIRTESIGDLDSRSFASSGQD
nr:hypothetical protein BaRGS_014473 [Batillaria attramentaria]